MSQRASWIADEYGGSYLNNPEQQNRDLAAARDMATLIKQTVQAKGGDAQRTGQLIDETLDELRGRAPFGFVTPAFALGTTQVLLDRANQMSGPNFVKYLEGIKDRDNPLFFWQQSTLDPLMEEVKDRTRAHVEKIYGKSSFAVFEGMKGQHGALAYGAGAADAVLEEVGSGARGMVLAASNPVEAGRQVIEMGRHLDRVPQALKQQFAEAEKLVEATQLDDYHKGYLHARLVLIVLDAKDVVDVGMSLTNLSRQIGKGNVHNIGDAIRALDEGPHALRRDGNTPNGSPGTPGAGTPHYRELNLRDVGDAAVASLPPERQPAYRQALDEALRTRGINDPEGARKFVADLNGAPDGPTMQGIHRRAGELMYGRPPQTVSDIVNTAAKSAPDNVEWAYQRAMQRTLREQGIDTPQGAQRYMESLRDANGPAMKTLHQRAYGEVIDKAVGQLPMNTQDYYRRAVGGLAQEKGHRTISEVQTYIGNLVSAPDGQSMKAVHNRARDLLMGDAVQGLPDNVKSTYREALGDILKERGIGGLSGARTYIDRLAGAPDGQSMRAVHNRAYDVMLDNTLTQLPQNARPAYKQALGDMFQEKGLNTLSAQQTHIGNLVAAPNGPSMQALHNRAFNNVVDNAVNGLPQTQRPAYRQALREQFAAGGVDTVAEAQRYVIDLASSPATLSKIRDRADAILHPSNTPGTDVPNAGTPGNAPRVPSPDAQPPNKTGTPPSNAGGTSAMPPDGPPPRTPRSDASPPAAETPPRDRPPSADNPPSNPSGGMGGGKTPGDRPVAGGNPDDPQNRPGDGTPTPRQQDFDLTRPRTFSHGGKQWDIIGVNDGNPPSLELVSQNAVPRFVPADALLPRALDGQLRPREVSLVQTNGRGEVISREAYTVVGVEDKGLRISRNDENGAKVERVVPYNAPNTEVRFDFPNGANYAAKQTVNGSVRFEPVGAERATVEILPGMRFEARLQGRELEGSRLIEMNPRGELFARNPEKALATPERISSSDIAPTWQKVTSSTAPGTDLYMDSANYRRAGLRSGRDGESLDTIGTIDGQSKIQHGFANQIYKPVLDALRNPATTGDVSIAMYGIGTSLDGKRYTEALLKYADTHPNNKVTIHSGDVQINGRTGEDLKAWLGKEHPNITITEPPAPSNFRVPHEKIIAIGDQVFISSEKIGMTMSRKIGFMTELGGEDAQLMHKYIQQLGDPKAASSERSQVLGRLAERGVLIDDPIAGHYPNAAAMNRTIAEAQGHLRIFQSDVSDVEAAKLIAKRAESGIPIDLKYRGIDPESKRILDEAAERFPNLKHQLVAANGPLSPIYQHENFVLSEKGGVLSSAYMWEPKAQQVPRYTNGGEGGVLLNADQARQYEQFLNQSPTREIGPRAVLNEIEEALKKPDLWPKLWEMIEQKLPWNRNQASAIDSPQSVATAKNETSNAVSSSVNASPHRPQEERLQTMLGNLSQSSALMSAPPQPGDNNFLAYHQSTKAADQLNAALNLPRSESTEKLVVAAATLGVVRDQRVDEIALNKPTVNQPGGTTAFVIEKTGNPETDRIIGTLSIPQVMQMRLDEGYRTLAQAVPAQTLAQNPQQTQLLGQEEEQAGRKIS